MASVIDICNLALARLSDTASISSINPPEGSDQADHANRFFPAARDKLLESYDWSFSVKRFVLPKLAQESYGWEHVYGLPADLIHAIAVVPKKDKGMENPAVFEIATGEDGLQVLYCDLPEAVLRYTAQVTDVNRFTPLFVEALTWELAAQLAGPLIRGKEGMEIAKLCLAQAQSILNQAKGRDIIQRHRGKDKRLPSWISFRRGIQE